MKPFIKILDYSISNISLNEILSRVSSSVINKDKLLITYVNSYIVTYYRKERFHSIINKFHILHSDGIGIYWASKFLYMRQGLQSKTTGTDLYFKLFYSINTYKYFILGGVPDFKELIQKTYDVKAKNINIVGSIYKADQSQEDIQTINNSGADILMVALGTPYQEEWIIQNKDRINVPVIIAVGSGLDFLVGVKKRAPFWMQKNGLEWFYRLFQEPKRLWRRYILGIPIFVFNIIVIKVKLLFNKEST